MRRWNGWGDDTVFFPLPQKALKYLAEKIGEATSMPETSLDEVLLRVPPSRLPDHPLVTTSAEARIRHSRGQSLPDWLALRSGFEICYPEQWQRCVQRL
jgi:alkyldihydroxyacetonephosphate synthase